MKKLYMVSLGPGDVELLTLKALKVFKEVEAICVPTKSEDHSFNKSISHKIVLEALAYLGLQKKIVPVYSPMRFLPADWEAEADVVLQTLQENDKVAFVTLGDAGIYSSIYYLLDIIEKKAPPIAKECEVIAGVTSFSASSAKVKKALCLGDERLEIEPINPRKTPQTTKILMRPRLGMDTKSLGEGDFYTFENLYLENENITKGKIATVKRYMTLFINFAKRGAK